MTNCCCTMLEAMQLVTNQKILIAATPHCTHCVVDKYGETVFCELGLEPQECTRFEAVDEEEEIVFLPWLR